MHGGSVDPLPAAAYRAGAMAIPERWRGMRPLPADIADRLSRLADLFRRRGVRLAYVFGSAARGGAADDVDLAVLMREGSTLSLFADVARALETDRIDLVDLAYASPLLRFSVARDGRVLFRESAEAENEFELAAIREYRDTRFHREVQDRYVRERARR